MSIESLITKIESGKDITVISEDFFDQITARISSKTLANFGLTIDGNQFVLEYVKIYDYILKNGFENIANQGFSQEVLNEVKKGFGSADYKGVNKNLEKDIKAWKEKNPGGDIKKYILEKNQSKVKQVSGDLTQRLGSVVAKESGKTIVFGITRQDEKVRSSHKEHNNKWWRLDSGYEPWYDSNCRCTYIYEEDTELVDSLGLDELFI
ncbi:MAG: hypothetical protein ACRCTS_10360 [Fusobacteriaceae bacterium]